MHARCLRHGGCSRARPTFDVSGSPCQPWSGRGHRQGKESPDIVLFLVWCKLIRHVRPYVVVHENVPGFDSSLLEHCLGDRFDIVTLHTSPKHCGFTLLNRTRVYSTLMLRGETELVRPLQHAYAYVSQVLARTIEKMDISWCCVATSDCLLTTENARRHRGGLSPVLEPSGDWSYFLTAKQQAYLDHYLSSRRTNNDASFVCDLSQNPKHRRTQLCRDGAMPTFTRPTMLWVVSLKRWLLPCEMAFAMGLPITDGAAACAQVQKDTSEYSRAVVGNMMHVACVGTILSVALSCVAPRVQI